MTTTTEPRTRAWDRDEFAIVNGMRCVYTATPKDILIRLPGGAAATARQLRAAGFRVVEPARPRLIDAEAFGTD